MKKFILAVSFLALFGCHPKTASYPSQPITLVVPVAPGGNSDFVSRLLAKSAEKYLGEKINVINRPGGSASIGLESVRAAKPDGYTIGYTSDIISILKHLGYSDIEPSNFDLFIFVQTQPAALSVLSTSPYKTLADFLKAAKSKPASVAIANSGAGTLWHLAALALEKKTEVQFKHVPFDGSTPALVALLGGHVDAAVTGPSEAYPHVQAGKLRLLSVMDQERFPLIPDVPTLKEEGHDLQIVGWGGFLAPKGTPPQVLAQLHDAFKKAFDEKEVQEAYARRGLGYVYKNGSDFTKFASEQVDFFAPMTAGLAPVGLRPAETFPKHAVTLVVQSTPGGGSDFISRTLANAAEKYLGQKIDVINKPGGGGAVGMSYVASAKPDGYTIGFTPVDMVLLRYQGFTDIGPEKFELIMRATTVPAALLVRADSPYKTLADFLAAAKSRPGQLSVGNAGTGGLWDLSAISLEKAAHVLFKHVPFDGAAPSLVAAMGGHIDATIVGTGEALPHVQSGKMRILGVMDRERFSLLPDVPTMKEQGYDVALMSWGGLGCPKGTPPEVVRRLHDVFKKAFDDPEVVAAYARRGFGHDYLGSADFTKFAESQLKLFEPLALSLKSNK